ncbi:uncharacterized protein BDW43DRAFT_266657 [Aspergillus alliaceus]|uniref:uncharacterized protein n=1 Tax=Petromyces alliaceus TaxID=209559 RepID=UPI0012A51D4D|nr:uncharacterized protein BDW43DRAFT_266657 [Aspergillus alliaceus]KAB8237002.1 hypothetical protein BDW43DRAFT_266657 [Aspergillus alliaceus]
MLIVGSRCFLVFCSCSGVCIVGFMTILYLLLVGLFVRPCSAWTWRRCNSGLLDAA